MPSLAFSPVQLIYLPSTFLYQFNVTSLLLVFSSNVYLKVAVAGKDASSVILSTFKERFVAAYLYSPIKLTSLAGIVKLIVFDFQSSSLRPFIESTFFQETKILLGLLLLSTTVTFCVPSTYLPAG